MSKPEKNDPLRNPTPLKYLRDYKNSMDTYLEEGRKIGIEEGKEIGREEGREIMIQNMLKAGMAFDKIAQIAGLSLEQVTQIANNTK